MIAHFHPHKNELLGRARLDPLHLASDDLAGTSGARSLRLFIRRVGAMLHGFEGKSIY